MEGLYSFLALAGELGNITRNPIAKIELAALNHAKAVQAVERGGDIEVVVSRGLADIRVPALVGLTREEARERLEAAGLRLGSIGTRPGRRNEAGVVVDQRPAETNLIAGAYLAGRGRERCVHAWRLCFVLQTSLS